MIPPGDETNRHLRDCLEESERQYQAKVTEVHGLRDANEALRRDNDDLTRQKERLIAEIDQQRRRITDLETEAETLRQRNASLEVEVGLRAPRTSDRKQNVDDEAMPEPIQNESFTDYLNRCQAANQHAMPQLVVDPYARQQNQIATLIRVLDRLVR